MKIICPADAESAYSAAAQEFGRIWREATGQTLEIAPDDDGGDIAVIGSDSVNNVSRDALMRKLLPSFHIRYGTDDYSVVSVRENGRDILFLAGGRGRSTLYAVYSFFEERAGCHYFWDGDILPRQERIDIAGMSLVQSPRFEYRGLRYFAHRGLHRFQAEHWTFEDWKREIDWVLKKRLNLFMLRIGLDDLYQQAFPDIVGYPPADGPLPEAGPGYDDRTLFWSLQYRGELRKKVLAYARERDLLHPEDCGTMTHWYSRTPQQFLDAVKPDFMPQTTNEYRQPTGMVWDIRQKRNLDNYFALTKTHVEKYGQPGLFHTIGLAERLCSSDREENIYYKLYTYRKIADFLRREYPRSPLLIAGWDFAMYWYADEVERLTRDLDPEQSIIFDYTSDTTDETNNFQNWGVVGKFPWIFGIFHAFEPNSDIRGNYDILRKRLPVAAGDGMCRGLVYWPELSHSDTLMLEFFTENAWSPDTPAVEDLLPRFCTRRYGGAAGRMEEIWREFLPIAKLCGWRFDREHKENEIYREYFFDVLNEPSLQAMNEREASLWRGLRRRAEEPLSRAPGILQKLAALPKEALENPLLRRDAFDILRTLLARCANDRLLAIGIATADWKAEKNNGESVAGLAEGCLALLSALKDVLNGHGDYSMNETLQGLRSAAPVNPLFEPAMKHNVMNSYCRGYAAEFFEYLCLPENEYYLRWLTGRIARNEKGEWNRAEEFAEARAGFEKRFEEIPLAEMAGSKKGWDVLTAGAASALAAGTSGEGGYAK